MANDATAICPAPWRPRRASGPRKESQNASGRAFRVAEIEVVSGGVVEVYGALDEPQAENAGVEIEIPLGVARDTGNVMNAGGCKSHGKGRIGGPRRIFAKRAMHMPPKKICQKKKRAATG